MSEPTPEEVVQEIVQALAAAHAQRVRGFIAVRCTGPREVDHARETLIRTPAPFPWKSLPASELDPPDLLGYVMHASEARGPCFLAYGLPRGRDGAVLERFIELINVAGRKYVMAPYLMVLLLTIDEIKDLSRGAPQLWRSRDLFVGWPVQDAASRFVPAVSGASPANRGGAVAASGGGVRGLQSAIERAGGGVESIFGNIQINDYEITGDTYGLAPWAGAPFNAGDEVPPYIAAAAPPAGRRWGRTLAAGDEEGAAIIDACRLLLDQRKSEHARQELARAAKRFRGSHNGPATAECYVLLGSASEIRFDHSVALEWYEQALAVYEHIGDDPGVSDTLNMIGRLRFVHGDLDGAFSFFDRAMRHDEEAGDELRLASGYRRIGIILEERNELREALLLYERAAEIERRNGDRFALCRSLHHQARLHQRKEMFPEARELLSQSLAIKEELSDLSGLAAGYHELGNLDLRQGQYESALDAYSRALEIEEQLGDVPGIAVTQAQLGLVHRELAEYPASVKALSIAREIFYRLQSPYVTPMESTLDGLRVMVNTTDFERLQSEARVYVGDLVAGG
ncbi:MAG: tetratricopeptide repeat protein [Deltaproteobacteria bacterium]|nr:tetratricopeptide repeat protein [Deltaproteobacteria bacterium]